MTAKTRADLIEYIADQFGTYLKATATSGSTSTILDTVNLYQPDDFWIGSYAYVLTDAGGESAAPEGEERPVTDFGQSASTATVSPVFSAAVAVDDVVEFLPVQRAILVRAINAAIRASGETWLVVTVDESTVDPADNDYDYTLPTDVVRLRSVHVRSATNEPWKMVPASNWRVGGTPGAQVLVMDSLDGIDSDDTLRLEYLARAPELSADSSSLGLGEPAEREMIAFIEQYALYWLHDRAKNRAEGAVYQRHYTSAEQCAAKAKEIKARAGRFNLPGNVRTRRWSRSRG